MNVQFEILFANTRSMRSAFQREVVFRNFDNVIMEGYKSNKFTDAIMAVETHATANCWREE